MKYIILLLVLITPVIIKAQDCFFRIHTNNKIKLTIYPPEYKQYAEPDTFIGVHKWIMELIPDSSNSIITYGKYTNALYNVMLLCADSLEYNGEVYWKRGTFDDTKHDYWLFRTGKSFTLSYYDLYTKKFILICVFKNQWFLDEYEW